MKRVVCWLVLLLLGLQAAQAHLGSPDVFFDGSAGPYPVSVTIRLPGVVPGRARVSVRVLNDLPVSVAFAPIAPKTAISNTPPPEAAQPVSGEPSLFTGELWLMTNGAYGIDIRVNGPAGEGAVQVPVNSVATRQLPLPSWLGWALAGLGTVLFCGGVAIVAAAAGESVLPAGVEPGPEQLRRRRRALVVTTIVFALLLAGGRKWWNAEEKKFRTTLREGGWPELTATVQSNGSQRILHLTLGDVHSRPDEELELTRDHGKILHLYLAGLPGHEAFAHIHPRQVSDREFEVVVPPLPAGDYEVLCDLTLAGSGFSSTATNIVHLPPAAAGSPTGETKADPDDSWQAPRETALSTNAARDVVCRLAGGNQIIWKSPPELRVHHNAGLLFETCDAGGRPLRLEPYMEMMGHAAVLRSDGRVFSHLHPSGNYSMAAQTLFDAKLARSGSADSICGPGRASDASAGVAFPYEFPTPGDYKVWVQFKAAGKILSAAFDASVRDAN